MRLELRRDDSAFNTIAPTRAGRARAGDLSPG
jgi:hypothetical protein